MTKDETLKSAHEYFLYAPETGVLKWIKCSPLRSRLIGTHAGCVKKDGYRYILLNGYTFKESRIIWWIVNREVPIEVDHINHVKDDNRLVNLRAATHSQNSMNKRIQANNTTGFKGVTFNKRRNKFKAQIKSFGKLRYLGSFSSALEAAQAYQSAAIKLHGDFAYVQNLGATE